MNVFENIEELIYTFKKKFWIIILITAITTSLGVFKVYNLKPTYVANAKVFIGKGNELVEYYTKEEVSYYSQLVSIFSELSKVEGFFDNALKKSRINKSSTEVAYSLAFTSSEKTPMINILYTSAQKEDIEKILNVVCEELIGRIKEIAPDSNPTLISEAIASTVYPNKRKIPLAGFLAGLIIAIMIILFLDFLDDKIISKKQLERVLPIPVLGDIPTHEKKFRKESKNVCNKQDA